MTPVQQRTCSSVTISIIMLMCLIGVSGMAFAAEDTMDMKNMDMKSMDKKAMDMKAMDMSPVNVNTATAKQLQTLPGIGKELAKRIVAYRTSHGQFQSVQELVKVRGIGKGTLAKMEERLTIGDTPMMKDSTMMKDSAR